MFVQSPPRVRKSKEESSSASALQRSELQHTQPAILALSYDIERRFCITAQLQLFSAKVLYVFTFFFLVRGAEDEIKCTLTGSVKTRQFAFKCNLTAPLGFSQTPLSAFYFVLSPSDEKKKVKTYSTLAEKGCSCAVIQNRLPMS